MDRYILLLTNSSILKTRVEDVLANFDIKLLYASSIAMSKIQLIEAIPSLIISSMGLDEDEKGGVRLFNALKEHSTFSAIPFLLISDESQDNLRQVAEYNGINFILNSSFTDEEFLSNIKKILPDISLLKGKIKESGSNVNLKENNSSKNEKGLEFEDKLKVVQLLLAKVLHNLKTSDLLQIVEREDIPKIVYEMTRSVCGIKTEDSKEKDLKEDVDSSENNKDVKIDLDSVFGLKK